MNRERVIIAEILRPRGTRGELIAHSETDVPGRLETLGKATVRLQDGADVPVEIADAWTHKGDWILKLAGIDSIDAANRFRRAELWVPISERAELPPGEFFRSDLIDCAVIDKVTGDCVGRVQGWQQYGGPPLMETTVNGREVLIPFVVSNCEVDLAARSIRIELPAGLLDL